MQISDMILGVNIIDKKVRVVSVNGVEDLGVFWDPTREFRGRITLRKFLGSKEHLDWLKIDYNAAKITTVQDYNKKNWFEGKYTYTVLKLRVKQVIYESKYNDNIKKQKPQDTQLGILKIYAFCRKTQ